MNLGIPKERRAGEARVAASPASVKKLVGQGHRVRVESGAGRAAAVPDEAFRQAGGEIVAEPQALLGEAELVLKVAPPLTAEDNGELDELGALRAGTVLVGLLDPYNRPGAARRYAEAGIDAYALELMPRITRAQPLDALSSQANLAGYRAAIEGAYQFGRAFPMMMTAAGTIPPAKVLVLGAGVAGLQAIATAGRLGAVVTGSDVRPEVKEQVHSLGAKFLEVEGLESAAQSEGGYAKEISQDFLKRQAEAVGEALKQTDIAITTALIPGKKPPTLIDSDQAANLKPGSVICDLAAAAGGNTPLTRPGATTTTEAGITVVGHTNWPARVPVDASAMYARNLQNFLGVLIDAETGRPQGAGADSILDATALARGGTVVNDPAGG